MGRIQGFLRNERGTAVAEFVIVFPLLIWAWLAMYYYWDAYRAINLSQKASFTVADTLSRQNDVINASYVDGMEELLALLAWSDAAGTQMRVTSVTWDAVAKKHNVSWSYSPNADKTALTTATLVPFKNQLPELAEFETVLVVETWIAYEPPLGIDKIGPVNIGVAPKTIEEFIVIRPRFIRKMCLTGSACA